MVLTRRAHRLAEIFHCLPNEILIEIIQHSHKADQATLSRVSKLFHDLCLPVLYRDVKISTGHVMLASIAIRSFFSGIMESPAGADVVRSFSLHVPHDYFEIDHRSGLILATLKLMSRLNHLSIFGSALNSRHWDMLLEQYNFPQLISCNIWAPGASPLLEAFLTRHSTLKRIHIQPGYRRIVPPQSASISLPHLECYHGDASFLPAIDVTNLKKVQLNWHPDDDVDVDKIIIGVSSMVQTKSHLQFVHIYLDDDHLRQILTSVSNHIQHTKTLRIRANSIMRLKPTTFHHITACLRRLTGLVYLEIGYNGGHWQSAAKAEDGIMAEECGAACPTLEGCCFHGRAWRKVDGRWEEYPVSEFLVLADGFYDPGY
ncbi:hypothetical protein MSAN_02118600 [Mycena sanguinolenta]|uniref:F-box domain-containing protein n=1 Tax=Mycena sanguinolenta TaxID=230812 RepID=A0A8H6XI31_9AGAR|nr:hypothetical protein MSAN_02118600 [Mycena sanguinolenta]